MEDVKKMPMTSGFSCLEGEANRGPIGAGRNQTPTLTRPMNTGAASPPPQARRAN